MPGGAGVFTSHISQVIHTVRIQVNLRPPKSLHAVHILFIYSLVWVNFDLIISVQSEF